MLITTEPSLRSPDAQPRGIAKPANSRTKLWLWLSLALAWTWCIHFWPGFHTANESIRLYFVQAVVETGHPELDPIVARHKVTPVDRSEYGGHIYMDKAPGLSLLALPIHPLLRLARPAIDDRDFWLLGWICTLFAVALPMLLALGQLQKWLRDAAGLGDRDSLLVVLALGLASPLFVYATLFFGHGLAAACVAGAVFGLARRAPEHCTRAQFALSGALLGWGGLTDTPVFVLAAMLSVWAWGRALPPEAGWSFLKRLQAIAPLLAGIAAGLVLQLAVNAWTLGSPLRFAYQYKGDSNLARIMATGFLGFRPPQGDALYGLFLGPQRGLFYHAPWLAVATAGLVLGARDKKSLWFNRLDAGALLAVSVGYALLVSGFADWPAGDCAGPRHLMPIVPLIGAGLAFVWRWPQLPRIGRAAIAAGIYVGALMAAAVVATFPYHFANLSMPVLQLSFPLVVQGFFAPSVGRLMGLKDWTSFGIFVVVCALPWLIRLLLPIQAPVAVEAIAPQPATSARPHSRPVEWTVAVILLIAWLVTAMASVPSRQRRKVEGALLKAQMLMGPDAYERDGLKPWQRGRQIED